VTSRIASKQIPFLFRQPLSAAFAKSALMFVPDPDFFAQVFPGNPANSRTVGKQMDSCRFLLQGAHEVAMA